MALRDAKIAQFNIVRVSSILPPYSKIISLEKGLKELSAGQIIHAVVADSSTDEQHRLMSVSIGVAVPKEASQFGYLSEHHGFGEDEKTSGEYAEDLAAQMLATILGLEFDPELNYIERKDHWKLSDRIVRTRNITQAGIGKKNMWTTVIAAAVLVPPEKFIKE